MLHRPRDQESIDMTRTTQIRRWQLLGVGVASFVALTLGPAVPALAIEDQAAAPDATDSGWVSYDGQTGGESGAYHPDLAAQNGGEGTVPDGIKTGNQTGTEGQHKTPPKDRDEKDRPGKSK
jgi:hypothetical protein